MRVVVIGGEGFLGSRIVAELTRGGNDVVSASPRTGVDTLTGRGLDGALHGAAVVIDASNASASVDPEHFFSTSTRTLLSAEARASVQHHVVVSIVGVDRLSGGAYFRGKVAQEDLVRAGPIPFSIVRATQFVEFINRIADAATSGDGVVRLPPILMKPIAADDAAAAVVRVALGSPLLGTIDIAGPARVRLPDLVAQVLATANDSRRVVADPDAEYFGARVREDSLIPAD